MATRDILTAVKTVLVNGFPQASVQIGIPETWNVEALFYLYHRGYGPSLKASGGPGKYDHQIPIRVALLSGANEEADELALADLTDTIDALFLGNHKLLDTTGVSMAVGVQTCHLDQLNGPSNAGIAYMNLNSTLYRTRDWTLTVTEYRTVKLA